MSNPTLPGSTAPSSTRVGAMHVQRAGRVEAVLDGNAHLRVWEPNRSDDRIDCDLTEHLALVVDLGVGRPPAREPHWTDSGGTTVIVSLDLGSHGRLLVDGHDASSAAATALAAAGFIELLRRAVAGSEEQAPPVDDVSSQESGSDD